MNESESPGSQSSVPETGGRIEAGEDEPGNTTLEKIMRERFGAPEFGGIMNTIMDEMFKTVDRKKKE